MHDHYPYPWVFYTGVALFNAGVLSLIALMLGEIGKTTGWRVPRWTWRLRALVRPYGRHARPIYQRRRKLVARYRPGRVPLGLLDPATTVLLPDRAHDVVATAFLPTFLPTDPEPGPDSPIGGADGPSPLDEEAYQHGWTMEFPAFAQILREHGYAKAGAR